jgi:hypothetical protein
MDLHGLLQGWLCPLPSLATNLKETWWTGMLLDAVIPNFMEAIIKLGGCANLSGGSDSDTTHLFVQK